MTSRDFLLLLKEKIPES